MADCDVPTALLTSTDREIVVNGATVEAQKFYCHVVDEDGKQSQVVGETDKMVVESKAALRCAAQAGHVDTGTPDPASRDVISIFVVAFDSKEGNTIIRFRRFDYVSICMYYIISWSFMTKMVNYE